MRVFTSPNELQSVWGKKKLTAASTVEKDGLNITMCRKMKSRLFSVYTKQNINVTELLGCYFRWVNTGQRRLQTNNLYQHHSFMSKTEPTVRSYFDLHTEPRCSVCRFTLWSVGSVTGTFKHSRPSFPDAEVMFMDASSPGAYWSLWAWM